MSILYIYNKGITSVLEINKKTNINNDFYVYEVNRSLIDLGLINQEKKGRIKVITLTDKGKQIAEVIDKMFALLEITEDSFKKDEWQDIERAEMKEVREVEKNVSNRDTNTI